MLLLKRGANDTKNDVVALLDTDGNVVVKYKYDAWGNESKTVDNCFWRSETAENVQSAFDKQGAEGRRLCLLRAATMRRWRDVRMTCPIFDTAPF